MARDVQDAHFRARDLAIVGFLQQAVRMEGLDLELEPVAAEKPGVGDHRGGIRVVGDLAAVTALDFRCVGNMVEVAVRQEEPIHFLAGKPFVGSLRRIKEEVAALGFQKKRVGIERAPGK
jgi:hypothetical protein